MEHEGRRQDSPAEVDAIRAEIERMLAAGMRLEDFKVVAPYNAQVNLLREALPEGVPVGTVDKFQGQEAEVVFYSMASSSGEDIPRSLEFLFSRNRLNVAISRARCLALPRVQPAAPRGGRADDRAHAAGQRALSLRGDRGGRSARGPERAVVRGDENRVVERPSIDVPS